MSAEMKASVLLTLKDQLSNGAKAASNALKDLTGATKGLKGGTGLAGAAKDADSLSVSATKAATATRDVATSAKGIGSGFAAAAKDADALAAAASRAAAASAKAASAAKTASVAGAGASGSGKDTILYGASGARENAAKSNTPMMLVKGSESQRAKAIANNLDRANPQLYKGAKGAALLEEHTKDQMDNGKRAGGHGGGDGRTLGGKAMDAYFATAVAGAVAGGVDHIISKAGDVSAMREKIKWALGGDKKGADAAYQKAIEMSAKYKNTSVVENLHIIDDLRANLPESFDEILHHSTEPFIKMHGFFKAWAGGKHAGTAEKSLQAIGAAIRSGELVGNMTGDALAKHAEAISTAQVVFGEKFSAQKYLQGTQKAATALASSDDTFKYVDFPVLLQRLNDGGAVALRGLFDKAGSGNKVAAQSAEAWRALNLVDMDQVELTKAGTIKGSSLLGKDWLKGATDYRLNMTDAIMTKVVPAMAKYGGLKDLEGLDTAWKAGDVQGIVKIMAKFREDSANMGNLAKWAAALAKDPKAGQAVEELILGAASIKQDRQRSKQVQKDKENFESYDKSKQEVGAQTDRLLQVISGDDLSGNMSKALSATAREIGAFADGIAKFKADLKTQGWFGATATLMDDVGKSGSTLGDSAPAPGATLGNGIVAEGYKAYKEFWNGPMGPEDPNAASKANAKRYGAIYQDDAPAKTYAAGPEVPTLVGGSMVDGAAGMAPAGITIQANGPQVAFNQAPPSITTHVTVNVTTNASPGEIGAAVGSAVSGAGVASVSGALHDGAY